MGFVKDEGDGNYNGRSYGEYIEAPEDYVIQFGETGAIDTNFILPSASEWFMLEVCDVNGMEGYIGLTVFSADVSNLLVDMEELRVEAVGVYTSFYLRAMHYKTNDLADIYVGSDIDVVALGCVDQEFIVPSTVWEITTALTGVKCVAADIFDEHITYDITNIATEFVT